MKLANPFIELGFWPGGDRDGNPFVNAATTIKVAQSLRSSSIVCYYRDVRKLKRKLTFGGVDTILNSSWKLDYMKMYLDQKTVIPLSSEEIIGSLTTIRQKLINEDHYFI
jgi:phosphoenolpyruvate carboxylase